MEKTDTLSPFQCPPYRVDVVQEADIVEEILRIYGFNNIELSDTASTEYLAEFPSKDIDKYQTRHWRAAYLKWIL